MHTQCVGRETGRLSNLYHQPKEIIGFIYYWPATDTDTGYFFLNFFKAFDLLISAFRKFLFRKTVLFSFTVVCNTT